MGGGVANKTQANAANAGATQSATQGTALSNTAQGQSTALAPQATQYGAERQQLYNSLWGSPAGSGSPSTPGAVTPFLDPGKLNVTEPTGPYAQQFTRQKEQLAQGGQDAVASVRQAAANRGFTGSGLESDEALKARLGTAEAVGNAYNTATTNSYQDALNNFWKAVSAAQTDKAASQQGQLSTEGQQSTDTGQAIQANQGAAQTYSQLYGTAGAYHPSPVAGIVQSAIGAGGALGSGAIQAASQPIPAGATACVCELTPVLMSDGTYKFVETLKAGDRLKSPDGRDDQVLGVEVTDAVDCWLVATQGGKLLRASATHTLQRPVGGYVLVSESFMAPVLTLDGPDRINEITPLGKRKVYRVRMKYTHAYLTGGLWSLE